MYGALLPEGFDCDSVKIAPVAMIGGTYCVLAALLAHRQDHWMLDLVALVQQARRPLRTKLLSSVRLCCVV